MNRESSECGEPSARIGGSEPRGCRARRGDDLDDLEIRPGNRKDSGPVGSYVNRGVDERVETSHRGVLERLYRDQRDRMWRAVFAFAGDREIASDAVAEAFTQALRRGDAIRSPERWLWRTIFRIAAGELKERGRGVPDGLEGAYEMNELARDLVAALQRLPDKQRASVVLHHAVGYSAKEIAEIIGTTTAGVHVLLSRGRKRLRELLETDDA
jgi:RNA polymerase sigma-70 factor, ECF subfamily